MTLADRIAELIEQHGSLRAAARVLECDAGYLSRLQSGEKDAPEDWLLRRMGLRRAVTYERLAGQAQAAPAADRRVTDEFNGWYCAHCQRGVDSSEVTFHEQHESCGRVITDDRPPASPTVATGQAPAVPTKLWLWRNHVDGRPEYWAFDNPYPRHLDNADPQTLGEPCGYAIFKPSRDGSNGRTEEKVLRGIAGAILHRSSEEAHASLREWAKRTVASPDAAAGEKP